MYLFLLVGKSGFKKNLSPCLKTSIAANIFLQKDFLKKSFCDIVHAVLFFLPVFISVGTFSCVSNMLEVSDTCLLATCCYNPTSSGRQAYLWIFLQCNILPPQFSFIIPIERDPLSLYEPHKAL